MEPWQSLYWPQVGLIYWAFIGWKFKIIDWMTSWDLQKIARHHDQCWHYSTHINYPFHINYPAKQIWFAGGWFNWASIFMLGRQNLRIWVRRPPKGFSKITQLNWRSIRELLLATGINVLAVVQFRATETSFLLWTYCPIKPLIFLTWKQILLKI